MPQPIALIARTQILCLAAALSCAAAAASPAQITEVWRDTSPQGFGEYVSLAAHPDGGVVSVTSRAGPGTGVRWPQIQRVDENGDLRWVLATTPAITGPYFATTGLAVDPASGDIAISLVGGADQRILYLDSAGTIVWDYVFEPAAPNLFLSVESLSFSEDGDVLVAGHEDDFASFNAPTLSLISLDGSSGSLRWRTQLNAVNLPGVAATPTGFGATHYAFAGTGAGAVRLTTVDLTGAITLSTPIDTFLVAGVSYLTPRAGGGWFGYNTESRELRSIDAAGTVAWERPLIQSFASRLIATANDDAVLLFGGEVAAWDGATGAPRWTHTLTTAGVFGEVLALNDGSVMAATQALQFGPPAGMGIGGLEVIDASGVLRNTVTLTDPVFQFGLLPQRHGLALDARGNVFAGLVALVGGGSLTRETWTLKVVPDGLPGQAFCVPAVPNSTGQPASLTAAGTDELAADNLSLTVASLPPGATTLLVASMTQGTTPGAGGGQGTLCLTGPIGRYARPGQIRSATASGTASLQLDWDELPTPTGLRSAVVGETWSFQAWYVDANPSLTSNFTNGLEVTLR